LHRHPLAQLAGPEPQDRRVEADFPPEHLSLLRGETQGYHAIVHGLTPAVLPSTDGIM
jgi:hypothetical protein